MTTIAAIRFKNVTLSLQHIKILHNISGTIPKGQITTFVGPSGAGKTTLLKLCNQLISQTSGQIFIEEQLIENYNPIKLRQQVGIALQSAPMIRGSVYDNLKLPRELQNSMLSIEEATSILTDVGLDETFLKKDANKLSGGQKQRVSIARTLINHSEILLLDEITSALDLAATKEIEELILHINKKYKVTIIWITHNLQQAAKIGDYMWVLKEGQLLGEGNYETLKTSSNNQIQQFFMGVTE